MEEKQIVKAKKKTSNKRIDWMKLKMEFMKGPWKTTTSFLRDKNMSVDDRYYRGKTTGWSKEKEGGLKRAYQKAIDRVVKKEEDEAVQVTQRHASIARYMQSKGIKALETAEVKDADMARKLIATGIDKERQAVISEKDKPSEVKSLTQVNLSLPTTHFDKLIEELDYEGLLRLIAEVKRQRAVESRKETVIEGETEA